MDKTLTVRHLDTIIFTSDSHWLHPLFELNDFLATHPFLPAELTLHDKVAGLAAASMIVYLGVRRCHIELISQRAVKVFEKAGVAYTFDTMVEQIDCRTEYLINDEDSVEDVWLFLRKRAGKVMGMSITIENLCVSVTSGMTLKNLNLNMQSGEQLVIYGSNGAGKTTLLKSILGLIKPSSGVIKIGDYQVGSPEWKHHRSDVAYVHQENVKSAFPISASEVVSIGLAGSKLSTAEVAYKVELAMRRTGCFNLHKRSYHSLSGGEKQRVSLARCLCQDAKVLLLDEPTSFLDNDGREELLALLHELCSKETPTIVIVSHDPLWTERLGWDMRELKGGRLC